MSARAVVLAYHDVGHRCLSVLLAHGVDVTLVVTHRDAPGENIWFASVERLAREHGLPLALAEDLDDDALAAAVAAARPDFLFSFYFRRMLPPAVLALAPRGALNMHGSLLPRYRGRVPVNWAIIHGERETGATLHAMVEKPDAGGIVAQQAVPILPDDTAFEVFNKVTLAAEMALDRVLPDLIAGRAVAQAQDLSAGSYFGGRKAEDGRIDWTRPAQEIHNLIRAVAPPYPGAFCDLARGRLRVLRSLHPTDEKGRFGRPTLFERDGQLLAECGDGRLLRLLAVEFAGSAALPSPPESSPPGSPP